MRERSVLLLAPAFLSDRRGKRIHGAEVFNLLLARKLVESGVGVTLPAERMWKEDLAAHVGDLDGRLRLLLGPHGRKPLWTSLAMWPRLVKGRHDLLVLGNVSRSLLPVAKRLLRKGRVGRMLAIAHQYPKPSFLKRLASVEVSFLAASNAVADEIRAHGTWPIDVDFGVQDPERFFPREGATSDARLHFGLVGQLDTPWKGAALALEGWARRPADVAGLAKLHCLAWREPPPIEDADVVLHDWVAPEEVGAFLRTLDALIVPSTSAETFSQVMVQGMLTGLPILAYDLPVLAEKLDRGGGIVFRTPEELGRGIGRLVREPETRRAMGRVARETALSRYVWRVEPFLDRYLGAD